MSSLPIPGTVRLVDVQGTSNLRHENGQKDIILVPQPTNDPNDPLNWSPKRRNLASVLHFLWAFFTALVINGLNPAWLLIEEETGITVEALNTGNGLMYLFFGFGNLITQPLALNFGRRPCAFFAIFITSFLVLWCSYMQTTAEWYANRILIGIILSGIESLMEICITDTKFIHERGLHMGLYNWSLFSGAFAAPIPAGFLADAAGWRWINKMYFIVSIVFSLFVFFTFEETMFYRTIVPEIQQQHAEGSKDELQDDLELAEGANTQREKMQPRLNPDPVHSEMGENYRLRSYPQRLKLWGARDPRQPNNYFKFFLLPIYFFRYPSIVFSGLLVGSVLAWYNVLIGPITQVFGGAPYEFSANMIGLTYVACIAGTTVGCLIAGWFVDKLAIFLARKNKGIKEPEARLWAAVVPIILHPTGCILYGVGAAYEIHWVGLCFGLGITTLGIVMGSTLALSYCVDCYQEVAGEAIVTVIIIRNCIGMLALHVSCVLFIASIY